MFSDAAWRLFLKAAELVFKLCHTAAEAFQNFAGLGGDVHAVFAVMPRGGAALDGIFKFLAAGAAGAGTLAGGRGGGHGILAMQLFLLTNEKARHLSPSRRVVAVESNPHNQEYQNFPTNLSRVNEPQKNIFL